MADKNTQEELNLDAKVTVKNIAPWDEGFVRISDGYGDVNIAPNGKIRLSRNEIMAQVQRGNKLFCGINGTGSHATLYIDDEPTRKELDFDNEDGPQMVFFNLDLKRLFEYKRQDVFEREFKKWIVTRAEKIAVMEAMKAAKVNDYAKIRFAEEYTGYKFQ